MSFVNKLAKIPANNTAFLAEVHTLFGNCYAIHSYFSSLFSLMATLMGDHVCPHFSVQSIIPYLLNMKSCTDSPQRTFFPFFQSREELDTWCSVICLSTHMRSCSQPQCIAQIVFSLFPIPEGDSVLYRFFRLVKTPTLDSAKCNETTLPVIQNIHLPPILSMQQDVQTEGSFTLFSPNQSVTDSSLLPFPPHVIRACPYFLIKQTVSWWNYLISKVVSYLPKLISAQAFDLVYHITLRILAYHNPIKHKGELWLFLLVVAENLIPRKAVLELTELSLKDCSVIGTFRIQLIERYHKFAVPPYCFHAQKFSFLPYTIRYIQDVCLPGRIGSKNVYFNENNDQITVEQTALEYYKKHFGYRGIHDEGKSICKTL